MKITLQDREPGGAAQGGREAGALWLHWLLPGPLVGWRGCARCRGCFRDKAVAGRCFCRTQQPKAPLLQ